MDSSTEEKNKKSNEFKLAVISITVTALLSIITLLVNNYYQSKNLLEQYSYEYDKLLKTHELEMKKSLKISTCSNLNEIIKGLSSLQLKEIKDITLDSTADEMAAYNMSLIYLSDEHKKRIKEDQNYFEAITRMLHSATKAYVECLNL